MFSKILIKPRMLAREILDRIYRLPRLIVREIEVNSTCNLVHKRLTVNL